MEEAMICPRDIYFSYFSTIHLPHKKYSDDPNQGGNGNNVQQCVSEWQRVSGNEKDYRNDALEIITMRAAKNCRPLGRYIESHLNHQICDATPIPFAFVRLEAFSL